MFDNLGNPKMKIIAYKDPKMNPPDKTDEFTALLNPENYTLNYEAEYEDNQAQGSSSGAKTFSRIKPKKLEFEFLFDRTGAIPGSGDIGKNGVEDDVVKFREVVLGWDGETHRPPYLQLLWGKLSFKCNATNVSIEYKLFQPDGTPIRALAKAAFEEFIPDDRREAEERNNSPDLTHKRIVNEGDTLPLMTHNIYGDSKYYMEVARFNGLNDFRNLEAGQEIYFPPLEKGN